MFTAAWATEICMGRGHAGQEKEVGHGPGLMCNGPGCRNPTSADDSMSTIIQHNSKTLSSRWQSFRVVLLEMLEIHQCCLHMGTSNSYRISPPQLSVRQNHPFSCFFLIFFYLLHSNLYLKKWNIGTTVDQRWHNNNNNLLFIHTL